MKTAAFVMLILFAAILGTPGFSGGNMFGSGAMAQPANPTHVFSNQEVQSACPKLPNAHQLLSDKSLKLGMIQMNVSNPSMSTIRNYTSTVFGYLDGKLHQNFDVILVSNGSVWVQVPESLLESSGCSAALSRIASSVTAGSYVSQNNVVYGATSPWAIGAYSDPVKISNSQQVTGVMSYTGGTGTWSPNTTNCPNSVCYLGYDVLTGVDNLYGYQVVLQNVLPHNTHTDSNGYDAVVQVWNVGTGTLTFSNEYAITYSTSSAYPLKILYVSGTATWNAYFNGNLLVSFNLAIGENAYLVTGNQPNAAVETDDSTQGDFSGFSSNVGSLVLPSGGSGGTCPCTMDPTISYYVGGAWNPAPTVGWPPSGNAASGYVYDGGSLTGFAFAVGLAGPPSWIGISSPGFEEMAVCISGASGCTTPSPAQGTTLWLSAAKEIQSNWGHGSLGGSSFSVSFSNSVKQGDLLIALVGSYTASATFGVSDTQSNSWTSAVSSCTNDCVRIFYTTANSASADTVNFTTTSSVYTYGFVIEFSGASGTIDKTSSGSGSSSSPHVTSITPKTEAIVVGIAAGPNGWSVGSGLTMISSNTGWSAAAEYGVYWEGSTTVAWSSNSATWGEVACSFK